MSGWLPLGVTDADIDRACPGYYDEPEEEEVMNEGMLTRYDAACRALADCSRIDEVMDIHDKAMAIKAYAKQAENRTLKADAERIIWRAIERVGQLKNEMQELGELRRQSDGQAEEVSQIATLADVGLDKYLASKAGQTAALDEAMKVLALAGPEPDKAMKNLLAKTRREQKHQDIAANGRAASIGERRFALIYADPPWKFKTYSEKGLDETSPDKHYPTMPFEEIAQLMIEGRNVSQIAAKDAALFMWCTSSNLELALPIMRCWGFTYRTHMIWDKVRTGTGYIFLNQHELLLYGKRGEFPMPELKPPSVLTVERTAHSVKPPEMRGVLEGMYPSFGEENRLELFARGMVEGWTTWGNQA